MKLTEGIDLLEVDEGMPQRVLKTSIVTAAIVLLFSFSQWSLEITLGLAIGMGIIITFTALLIGSVRSLVKAGKEGGKLFFTLVTFSKFILLSAVLILVFKYLSVNYLALLTGIGLVQAVIFLKLTSIVLVNYLNRSKQKSIKRQVVASNYSGTEA